MVSGDSRIWMSSDGVCLTSVWPCAFMMFDTECSEGLVPTSKRNQSELLSLASGHIIPLPIFRM